MKLKKAINAILICCIIQAFQTTAISQVAGEIANWQNNKKAAVSIQWDGWYWGHGNVAIPELLKRGMTGTFFVTTDTDDWMPVDWDMVKYAAENGIEIANHSSLHECTPSRWDFDLEVDSAKVRLERRTGKRVYTYAYACGAWNAEFAKRVEATGHVAARGVNWPGHIPTWDIPLNHFVFSYDFELEPGFGYYHTRGYCIMSERDARQPLSKFPILVQNVIDAGGMLPYFYHDIEISCPTGTYCNTVERFNAKLDILETFRDQIWIATYGDAIRYHRQAKAASLQEVEAPNGQSWTIKLTHTLPDKDLFDFPLTIMLKMNGVDYEKITQNGKKLDFTIFNDTIMFNAIPNGEHIVLETNNQTGIIETTRNNNAPKIFVLQNTIEVISTEIIKTIEIYSVSGALVKSIRPEQTIYQFSTNDLMQGAYILKVATETAQKNEKMIVR